MTIEKTFILMILILGYYRILKDGAVKQTKVEKSVQYGQTVQEVKIRKVAPYYDHGKFICYIKV